MEESRRLARFLSRIRYEDLPGTVIDKAKDLILDQLGCQLAGSTMPWSGAVYEHVTETGGERQESTIVRFGRKMPAQEAAFANACFGNAFLGDDTDSVCHAHLGSIIIPCALAMAEREGSGGRDFLKAVVAGYEAASRVGAAAFPAESRGYHPGPIFGPFGAAACAGALLGFDEESMLSALGIAGSLAGGLMEYSLSGGTVNRIHSGIAAGAGIRAALLVGKGFTGPATILEGERGFVRAFSGGGDLDAITRDLGERFRVEAIDLKAHCCCGTSGAYLDAVSRIMTDHHVHWREIEEIVVRMSPAAYRLTGKIVRPHDITSSQFAGRFGVALRLIKGNNSFREYSEQSLVDPEIKALEAKTTMIADEELGRMPRSDHPARVTVRMASGEVHEETVPAPRGSILNPMTKEELFSKFESFASVLLSTEEAKKVLETVRGLEHVKRTGELSRLLVHPSNSERR